MSHKSEAEFIANTHNTARFFVEHRQVSLVMLIAVCVWGWYGYQHMPKRKDPSIPVRVAVASTAWPGATGDKERVNRLLRGFPPSSRPALYQEFESKAFELVRLHWPWVCEFAKAIESKSPDSNGRRSLSQEEVAEIYSAITKENSSD